LEALMPRILVLISLLFSLAGCISSDRPLFSDDAARTPLPASFIMVGREADKMEAWRVDQDGQAYRWEQEKGESVVRLYPLPAGMVRPGFHVAMVQEEGDADLLYGLVEVVGDEIVMYSFDANERAAAIGVKPDDSKFSFATRFRSAEDLLAVMTSVAAAAPPGVRAAYADKIGDVRVFPLEVYDLADPARKAEGEELLAAADAARSKEQKE